MRKIGILGGSFNPVHCGHLMVASYVRRAAGLDEVWLSLSPANPLKQGLQQESDTRRMEMLRLAVAPGHGLGCTDLETTLPRPSYTVDFLDRLSTFYPDCRFTLIIGSDNWLVFDRWKASQEILDRYGVIIYPRPSYPIADIASLDRRARFVDAPGIDISSTMIRDSIHRGMDMNYFLPAGVYDYIETHNLYR